jgi:hypothetical protein
MIPARKDHEKAPLRESVEAVFRELLADLPENAALIEKRSDSRSTVIELVPSNRNAAPICVIVPANEKEGVTLIAGKGSFFEIPKRGRRYTNLPLVEEVRSICSAVIGGKLEEWVVLDGTDVLQGKGILELDQPVTVRWRQVSFRPFRKKVRTHHRYEPWAASSYDAAQGAPSPITKS